MNDVYTVQIDSINKVNAQLLAANDSLNTNLSQERSKNNSLLSENDRLFSKVSAGSVLKAMNVKTEGFRFKSNGDEVLTNKAKQVQKFRTKFVLAENRVIDNGAIDIYVRVLGPDGDVMKSTNKESFKTASGDLIYTIKQTVEYTNSDTPVDISFGKGGSFEIYHAGAVIGKSVIELK